MNRKLLSVILALLVIGFFGAGSAFAKKNLNRSAGETGSKSEYTAGVQGASAGLKADEETTKKIKEQLDAEKEKSIYANANDEEKTTTSNLKTDDSIENADVQNDVDDDAAADPKPE